MRGVKNKIKNIQDKPYQAKIKILWVVLTITTIIVIALWMLTLKFRDTESKTNQDFFPELRENLNKLQESNPFTK